MTIFNYTDYRLFLRQWIASRPRKGHGEVQKLADGIRVHPTLVSQILSGAKDFSLEQGQELGEYLGLLELEHEYLMALIAYRRAGSAKLKARYKKTIETLKRTSERLIERVPVERVLNDQEKAIFYSDWIYSAVRLQSSIDGKNTLEAMCEQFQMPRARLAAILSFLVGSGVLVEKNGEYKMGVQTTHLQHDSPFIKQHHSNWRLKSLQQASQLDASELMFTGPMSLSREDFAKFREELVQLIKRVYEIATNSEAEQVACLNIDWFKVDPTRG